MHTLRRQNKLFATANITYTDRFRAGFTHCAAEVSQFLNKIDQNANAHLMRHLRDCIQRCDVPLQQAPPPAPPPVLRMSSPPIPMDVAAAAPSTTYFQGMGSAAAAAVVAAAASKLSQIAKADASNSTNINNNNTNTTTNFNNNNNRNNNYLSYNSNHSNRSSNSGSPIMPKDVATNDPDNRPVLIKQSISPMMLMNKDDPHGDNVWRPW